MTIRLLAPALWVLAAASLHADSPKPAKPCKPKFDLFGLHTPTPTLALTTSVSSDGARKFKLVVVWDEKGLANACLNTEAAREKLIQESIEQKLAASHWCEGGWTIIERTETTGTVVGYSSTSIDGQCK